MLALATWTIILVAVLVAALLATLVMVSFGRASSRADDEADRLIAEHRQAQQARADTGVATPVTPPETVGAGRSDEDDDAELARSR